MLYEKLRAMDQVTITPDDDNDIKHGNVGIYLGTAGDLKVTSAAGTDTLLKNVVAGVEHSFHVRRIWATGTTATDIVALY